MHDKGKPKRRVLVIGLDGATWDLIDPWVRSGELPNIKRFRENGVWGILKSTIPPVTAPAWGALATGKNPGKTGLFDFLNRRNLQSYSLRHVDSRDVQGQAIWDYLSQAGKTVGICNYPMLYPPYEVNGFMISGAGNINPPNMTYPVGLKKELDQLTGGYPHTVGRWGFHDTLYDDEVLFLKDLRTFFNKRVTALKYLFQKKEWDFFIAVFSSIDWLHHLMWKHLDDSHSLFDPERSPGFRNEVLNFWKTVDQTIGDLFRLADEETYLFLVSDHGFGPADHRFYLLQWLLKEGYIKKKRNWKLPSLFWNCLSFLKDTPLKHVVPFTIFKWADIRVLSSVIDKVDFTKSRVFTAGHSIALGAIYLNIKDRDPQGIVYQQDRQKLKEEISCKLKKCVKEEGRRRRENIDVDIFFPEDIYEGSATVLAPDILFFIDKGRYMVQERFGKQLFKEGPVSNRNTGSHRINGIFLAYGPEVRKNQGIKNARIWDIAPTLLHLLGLNIPKDMDGKVLLDVFEKHSSLNRAPVISKITSFSRSLKNLESEPEEEERVRDSLRSMGYLD